MPNRATLFIQTDIFIWLKIIKSFQKCNGVSLFVSMVAWYWNSVYHHVLANEEEEQIGGSWSASFRERATAYNNEQWQREGGRSGSRQWRRRWWLLEGAPWWNTAGSFSKALIIDWSVFFQFCCTLCGNRLTFVIVQYSTWFLNGCCRFDITSPSFSLGREQWDFEVCN